MSKTLPMPGSPDTNLLLGIDFGTGSCKVTALDIEGRVVASFTEELTTDHPRPGWAEQQPADWYKALLTCLTQLHRCGLAKHVVALAFDGSTHNAVLLDSHMTPLRPTIMWTDQRSADEAAWLEQNHGEEIFRIGYQCPTPTWTLSQLLWLQKHESPIFKKISKILFLKDYVRYLLTGVICTDHIEAQGSLLYDMEGRKWSPLLCAMAGISTEHLPPLVLPTDITGKITTQAAQQTGLREGLPVICGSSDTAVESFAAGAIAEGQSIIKLATAGNFNVMTSRAIPDRRTLTYSHVIPGLWYSAAATNAAAVCLRWARDNFYSAESKKKVPSSIYKQMGCEAAESPAGARGIFFHPYLQGERSPYWDSTLRGSFTGLSLGHARGDLIRAIMEGVAFSLRDCRRVLEEMQLPIHEIRLIGGGAKDTFWAQIICDMLGTPVILPPHADASVGSALLAGVGVGIFPSERDAIQKCSPKATYLQPQADVTETYETLFPFYRQIHDAMAGVYRDIHHANNKCTT